MAIAPRITFLGIGLMGAPMARRLLQANFPLAVWNRTAETAAMLASSGATPHAHISEAVADADIVISMLEAGTVVGQVMADALEHMTPGALWIDMSSTQQAETLHFDTLLRARGLRFLDAPVSGGVGGAQAGTLAIMVGGSAADFASAEAVLSAMGRPVLVGQAGSGQVAKLCNQLIVGATLNVVAEALLLAQAAGADPHAVRDAIRGGFAESRILEVHGQRMLERNFVPGGQVKSQLKDMHNVLAAAEAAGIRLPLTALVTAHYASLPTEYAKADHAAVLLAVEANNPGKRLGQAPDRLPPA